MSQQGILSDSTTGSSDIETLTGDTGGAVGPDGAFNIDIFGGDTISVDGNPGTSTLTINASAAGYPITPYVVGPSGQAGYTTIQSAINAANSAGGGVVGLQPGTYTEDLTLYDNIQVVGFGSNVREDRGATSFGQIVINGSHTLPATGGTLIFKNVTLISSGDVFASAAAVNLGLKIDECIIGTITGYLINCTTMSLDVFINNTLRQGGGSGGFNVNSASLLTFYDSEIDTLNIPATIFAYNCDFLSTVTFTSSASAEFHSCRFFNTVTISGSSDFEAYNSFFQNLVSSAILNNSSGVVVISTSVVASAATAIDGTGADTQLIGVTFTQDDSLGGSLTFTDGTNYSPTLKADYTDHGVLLGQGTATNMVATAAGTNGQVLIGATSADPAFASLTSTGSTITFTPGANSLNLETGSAVASSFPTDGGTATPAAGALTIAGGTLLTTAGAASTVTINADDNVVGSVASDSGTATPTGNSFTITGTGGITTSGSGSTITIAGTGEQVISITSLDNGDTPYTVLTTDYYMSCDMSLGVLTIRLPNAPATGKVFIVKDSSGDAATSNITVTTVGGVVTIDGSTSRVISTDYASLQFVFNGSSYEVW